MDATRIVPVEELPEHGTLVFRVERDDEVREAILVVHEGGVDAWENYCQHFTHIKLDKGTGAPMRNGEIVCANHGAMFEADTGYCTFGPCEGAYLNRIGIEIDAGDVSLADERYGFVGLGPEERDPTDLSSKSNIEF
ncbi:Rieske (2Fe-2S) protein [Natronorarus salvus]|uniref:Rieske (2Fe-2S) protein n=1 Tax=Natronorarus salvus TaxID=3117733 RepID=UPI002F261E87